MSEMRMADWIGREETRQARLGEHLAGLLSATLEDHLPVPRADGDPLPPLWHWAAFPPTEPCDALGADGHPRRGGFLPPIDLPRQMWAGGALEFLRPLRVGERLTRHSVIREVTEKTGGSGRMVFVAVAHEVAGENGLALRERQEIVYLPMPDRFCPPTPRAVPSDPVLRSAVPVRPARLFRYSACTFNAQRIHYDLPYAQQVEKYPGLVVHGPLQATLLMMAACAHRGRPPDAFSFRGLHPLFHDDAVELLGYDDGPGTMTLFTAKAGAHAGMSATATWEDETR